MEEVAEREGVLRHARLGTAVTGVTWDDAERIWHVSFREVASGREGRLTARFVVSCVGGLHVPRPPDIPGVGSFGGPVIHTAKWDASVDLRGRTVAIIGTGASCVQASDGRTLLAVLQLYPAPPASPLPLLPLLGPAYHRAARAGGLRLPAQRDLGRPARQCGLFAVDDLGVQGWNCGPCWGAWGTILRSEIPLSCHPRAQYIPLLTWLYRWWIFLRLEAVFFGLIRRPAAAFIRRILLGLARSHLLRQLAPAAAALPPPPAASGSAAFLAEGGGAGEAEALRERLRGGQPLAAALTPAYPIGCKRWTPSDNYLRAYTRPNVALVTRPILRVEPGAVVVDDGEGGVGLRLPADVLVCATGFDILGSPVGLGAVGRGGVRVTRELAIDTDHFYGEGPWRGMVIGDAR